MVKLKEMIYKRRSIRKYNMTTLDSQTIEDIRQFAVNAKPLYDGIKVSYDIINGNVKGLFALKAPHYIAISSEVKEGYLTNAGFMMQQIDLYLQSKGFGSCWLGSAKPPLKADVKFEFVILLAFGRASEPLYRNLSEFKRKSLSEISDISDNRLEPARLAPSGINSQPWYFMSEGKTVHAYCVKHGAIGGLIYERMNKIDMGIALSHLYAANVESFRYFTVRNPVQMRGHYYVGSVEL